MDGEEKARIVAESLEADANISDVARRHGVARGLLTRWRREFLRVSSAARTELCRGEDRYGCGSVERCPAIFCGAGCIGSEGGAESWAILASVLNTAKLNGLDPQTYLCDVLERIVSGRTKNHQLHELLAWNWKAAR